MKEAQIEVLIASLPGIEHGEKEQVERLERLEAELKEAEREREVWVGEREKWVRKLEGVIEGVKAV